MISDEELKLSETVNKMKNTNEFEPQYNQFTMNKVLDRLASAEKALKNYTGEKHERCYTDNYGNCGECDALEKGEPARAHFASIEGEK